MAQYEEFTIDQGADTAIEIHVVDAQNAAKNLANYAVAAKMKKTFNSDSSDTQAFNAVVSSPAADGIITLSLTNAQTNALKAGRYVYDIELLSGDSPPIVKRVVEGQADITPRVTVG